VDFQFPASGARTHQLLAGGRSVSISIKIIDYEKTLSYQQFPVSFLAFD